MGCKVSKPEIIVALDFSSSEPALELVKKLKPDYCRLKVGKELFTSTGPVFIETLIGEGFDVFLDLKFHEIPNTVAKACVVAANMGVWMLNIHASGGRNMLMAAREAIDKSNKNPVLVAVTVLTSLTSKDMEELCIHHSAEQHVLHLAKLSKEAGMDHNHFTSRAAENFISREA